MPHPTFTAAAQSLSLRQAPAPEGHLTMRLLAAGVPLSLLMDLADPLGPDSLGIMANESPASTPRFIDLREKTEVAS